MKNSKILTLLSTLLLLIQCAQKKQDREDFKNEHNKDFLRNKVGNTAVPNSESANIQADSSTVSRKVEVTPTNYKKDNEPNTKVGGAR